MKVYQTIPEWLVEAGVDTTYTLMSEDTKSILADLHTNQEDQVTVVETRHEQNAVAMADGYARVTNDIGVCVIGRGPAIAQTGTALQTAQKRGSAVLAIVAESPLGAGDDIKQFPQQEFLSSLVDDVVSVRSTETLPKQFSNAISRLRNKGGPVVLQLPWDVIAGSLTESDPGSLEPDHAGHDSKRSRLQPPAEHIERTVELYLDSDATTQPVILAGRGAVQADAKEELETLAERMGALLATTLQARGLFYDHPFSIGFVGSLGAQLANKKMHETDFVYAVGCSLNKHTTDHARLFEEATAVHVDTDPTTINRDTPVDQGVVGDAKRTTQMLIDALDDADIDFADKFWTEKLQHRIAEASSPDYQSSTTAQNRVHPGEFAKSIDPLLPTDRIVVTDAGHFSHWVLDNITVTDPNDFIWTLDFAAIGQALPIGVGAARAATDRRCHAFCGDGGFMMPVQEIDTAARNDIPITIIVMNDDALGAEYHQLDLMGKHAAASQIDSPDIETVSRGLGAEAHTVRSLDDLDSISDRLTDPPDGPLVIDCKTDRTVRHHAWDAFEDGSPRGM